MVIFTKNSVLAIIFIAVVIAAGCSSRFVVEGEGEAYVPSPPSGAANRPTNGLVQSNTGGSVTIDVEWIKTGNDSLVFSIAMNTHSVDLDQYDLGELAVLRDNEGNEYQPTSWDSAPGGHHRSGTLAFPLPDSMRQESAKYLELVIRDIADIKERVLKWEL